VLAEQASSSVAAGRLSADQLRHDETEDADDHEEDGDLEVRPAISHRPVFDSDAK